MDAPDLVIHEITRQSINNSPRPHLLNINYFITIIITSTHYQTTFSTSVYITNIPLYKSHISWTSPLLPEWWNTPQYIITEPCFFTPSGMVMFGALDVVNNHVQKSWCVHLLDVLRGWIATNQCSWSSSIRISIAHPNHNVGLLYIHLRNGPPSHRK